MMREAVKMLVTIKGHIYSMKRNKYNKYLDQIRRMIPQKPTIIAVEKNGSVEMRNDVYPNYAILMGAVKKWNKEGFTVKFIKGANQN